MALKRRYGGCGGLISLQFDMRCRREQIDEGKRPPRQSYGGLPQLKQLGREIRGIPFFGKGD